MMIENHGIERFAQMAVILFDDTIFFAIPGIRSSMLQQLSFWAESQDVGPKDFRFVDASARET
jgi:hypothetical protein